MTGSARPLAPAAQVTLVAADGARARISPFGAHVLSWTTPDGREHLYLSDRAILDGTAAIRGGIPVIFPQFAGEGPLPKHGFARTATWRRVRGDGASADVTSASAATLELTDTDATRAVWPHAFRATLAIELQPAALEIRLRVANTGSDAFVFTAALHTYLAMDDAFEAGVAGLQGLSYRDSISRVPGVQREPVLSIAGAVNRVYAEVPPSLDVRDGGRTLVVDTAGFPDAVVWNPGAQGEAALGDMAPGDARRMLCVEPAVIERPVTLRPGETWKGAQRLRAS